MAILLKKYFNGKLSRSYEYEYDEFGNWTKKIEFKTEGKIPEEIIERITNYYELKTLPNNGYK